MENTQTIKLNCGMEIFHPHNNIEKIKEEMTDKGYKQVITSFGLKEKQTYKFI